MLLGVDIGGTFTDFVLADDAGRITLHKRLTSADDPARAVAEGVRELGLPAEASALVVHGSTIATNALLERRGARTALITTQGFADVLEIGRQNRPDLYALVPAKPPPLVPRGWRFELRERVNAQGEILISLDPQDVEALIPRLRAEAIESVAVCFLFSFLRPEHERRVREMLEVGSQESKARKETPTSDLRPLTSISLSSEILPEYREYERASTTVVNAYVAPLMNRYLARLEKELHPRPLRILQSNGGCITSAAARAQAARTALSGPAGGVVGAFAVARQTLTPLPGLSATPPPSPPTWERGVRVNAPTTPPAGPESTVRAACARAIVEVMHPPFDCMMRSERGLRSRSNRAR
jgi:N-methylhydantoinase A